MTLVGTTYRQVPKEEKKKLKTWATYVGETMRRRHWNKIGCQEKNDSKWDGVEKEQKISRNAQDGTRQ